MGANRSSTTQGYLSSAAESLASYARELASQDVSNYKVSAAASSTLAVLGLLSYVECGGLSTYLAIGASLAAGGMATRQFGAENIAALAISIADSTYTFFTKPGSAPRASHPAPEPATSAQMKMD